MFNRTEINLARIGHDLIYKKIAPEPQGLSEQEIIETFKLPYEVGERYWVRESVFVRQEGLQLKLAYAADLPATNKSVGPKLEGFKMLRAPNMTSYLSRLVVEIEAIGVAEYPEALAQAERGDQGSYFWRRNYGFMEEGAFWRLRFRIAARKGASFVKVAKDRSRGGGLGGRDHLSLEASAAL